MLAEFFQTVDIPANQLIGSYDIRLVILSFLVATSASYIALNLAGQLRDVTNTATSRLIWLIGGAVAMGAGIWSMHFIGMLSFTIPGLTLNYDPFWTVLSLVVAILASGFALYLLQLSAIRIEYYIIGGIILGLAIAAMHYTGMEGMLITLNIRYLPLLFFISILVAILASEAALWLAIKSTRVIARMRNRIKIVSALIMGAAICGMHYTGMAASIFTPLCTVTTGTTNPSALDPTYLSITIATVTFVILALALFASIYKESMNQQQFEKARQLGMAEISASVLHSVGNVLNSVNVSVNSLAENISASKMNGLDKLRNLLNENKHNLADFLANDPRGGKVLEFLNMLADYRQTEQKNFSNEINSMTSNLTLIKNIISTQQDLSKTSEFEQLVSINELIDEALIITGLNANKNILVEKHYGKNSPIKTDKVKLVQILVNLLRNAKDALAEANTAQKKIIITSITTDKNKVTVSISDNGIGISPKNLEKIFNYGFTTKESGHGFGLHTSALAVSTLGGKIHAESAGPGKGATFILEF